MERLLAWKEDLNDPRVFHLVHMQGLAASASPLIRIIAHPGKASGGAGRYRSMMLQVKVNGNGPVDEYQSTRSDGDGDPAVWKGRNLED